MQPLNLLIDNHLKTIIIVIAVVVVIIPFTGEVSNTANAWHKKILWRGWTIIILTIVGLFADRKLDDIKDKQLEVQNAAVARKYEKLTIVLEAKSQTAIKNSKDSIIFALAKGYNLVLDTTKSYMIKSQSESQKVISKLLSDSSLRQAKYTGIMRPILYDDYLLTKLTPDSIDLQVKLICDNATAYNVKINVSYGYVQDNGLVKFMGILKVFNRGDMILGNQKRTDFIRIGRLKNIRYIVVYFNGTYTDIPQYKTICPFEKMIEYDVVNKSTSPILAENYIFAKSLLFN